MKISFTIGADERSTQGKGASRRLRRAGKVPAILYGGHKEPRALVLDQQNLLTMIDNEKFYSSIVRVKVGESSEDVIIRDIQMHPARNVAVHVDLQRVLESEQIRIRLPIHFRNENTSPGVKLQGGVVSHMRADVEIICLPKDLPEFLELDLSSMNLNETRFLADIPLPNGVVISELTHGRNAPVVSIHSPRAEEPEPTAEAAVTAAVPAEGAAAAPGAGAATPAGAAGAAAPADAKKAAEPKKEGKEGGKK